MAFNSGAESCAGTLAGTKLNAILNAIQIEING
jgi:hypothetical protein